MLLCVLQTNCQPIWVRATIAFAFSHDTLRRHICKKTADYESFDTDLSSLHIVFLANFLYLKRREMILFQHHVS